MQRLCTVLWNVCWVTVITVFATELLCYKSLNYLRQQKQTTITEKEQLDPYPKEKSGRALILQNRKTNHHSRQTATHQSIE